ncbi:ABC transporter G family member 20-like isoform X2 [Biomphalaria glabrata]|nr:ABC transporter G family member 20-like isoform X2 [Biomphalaria glabrata]
MKIDGGIVRTLGQSPGARGHQVPGRMVGYMPQEIALFMNFSIHETLNFFGQLHGMTNSAINHRSEFLLNFLNLPDSSRLICKLSGGQQRRVSLAAALLQQPELLILDEPTVGVDPVLREKIWEHLLEIAKSSLKTTIIITTHYIEEAAQADKVGLMRGGRLLAENKPSVLMAKFGLLNLEAVFLHLCHRDRLPNNDDSELLPSISEPYSDTEQDRGLLYRNYSSGSDKIIFNGSKNEISATTAYGTGLAKGHRVSFQKKLLVASCVPSCKNIKAVSGKNLIFMKRNISLLLFEFLVPVIQIILFCVSIGGDPRDLPVSVCNQDVDELGTLFVGFISNTTMHLVMRDDINLAINDVRDGLSWSALHIKENFSMDLMTRLEEGPRATNATIDGSTIDLYQDMSNKQIAITIQAKMLETFSLFTSVLLESFGYNSNLGSLPIKLAKPVYGNTATTLTDFMACGVIVSATFFLACGLTAMSFILERKEGLIERMQVAGVNPQEIMIAHVVTQFLVMMGQVSLMLLIAFVVFNITNEGNLFYLLTLIVLQGLNGMALGLLISACCETEIAAIQAALGIMYPFLLTSGIIWPIEAMPQWMKHISLILPLTYPTNAARAIMGKGWGMSMTIVWSSYLSTTAWIVLMSTLSFVIIKIKAI